VSADETADSLPSAGQVHDLRSQSTQDTQQAAPESAKSVGKKPQTSETVAIATHFPVTISPIPLSPSPPPKKRLRAPVGSLGDAAKRAEKRAKAEASSACASNTHEQATKMVNLFHVAASD
jgi:hypothetical protein